MKQVVLNEPELQIEDIWENTEIYPRWQGVRLIRRIFVEYPFGIVRRKTENVITVKIKSEYRIDEEDQFYHDLYKTMEREKERLEE